MARPAQVLGGWGRRIFPWLSLRAALCAAAVVPLAACGAKGFSFEDAVTDRSIVTSSVSQQYSVPTESISISDEATIRDAVSSAIVDEIGENGIGWANAGTGSRGMIRNVSESRDNGVLCRRFTASRESFDGVYLYRGMACIGSARQWVMRSFDRVE